MIERHRVDELKALRAMLIAFQIQSETGVMLQLKVTRGRDDADYDKELLE